MANRRKKDLNLEKMKKKIIKILNSKNNPDGFLESFLMEDLVYVKKENEFQENHFSTLKEI